MADTATTGPRVIGSLRTADGKGIVRLDDLLHTTADDLWAALTDPDRLARWLGEFDGDLRAGGRFHARFWSSGWEGDGRVEACEPPRHLLVRTSAADTGEEHLMEAWLRPDGHGTRLVIEERGIPLDLLAAYGAGVQIHVEDLVHHLNGEQRCDAEIRWTELITPYRQLTTQPG